MRHRIAGRKLGRTSSHRMAMLRNMVTELLDKEKITTTISKAKALRPFTEKMITLGKRGSLHARRQALSVIRKKSVVHKLFDSLGPRYADRNGGYTRIVRLGYRKGDSAERALIELVGSDVSEETVEKEASKKSQTKTKSDKKD
ncbi:MAG: 50S ribosomal protein L17 [Acidobacteria bacterium]|nr:50S ribosomal protein L17 [Acidobacteriota bacterium]